MKFPFIGSQNIGAYAEAIAAIKVESLLKANLLLGTFHSTGNKDNTSTTVDPHQLQNAREALLASISSWSDTTSLEIRMTVIPDLIHKTQSHIELHMVIRCRANCEAAAREELAVRYLSLFPILSAHLQEAEFQPVMDRDSLVTCMKPFVSYHAVSVHRKKERIPLGSALQRFAIGFGSDCSAADTGDIVTDHLYGWLPSNDDWSRLIDTLTGQIDPLQIIVRLSTKADTEAAMVKVSEDIHLCEDFLAGRRDMETMERLVHALRDIYIIRLGELKAPCFNVGVFMLAGHDIDSSLPNVLGKAISGTQTIRNENVFFEGGFAFCLVDVEAVNNFGYFKDREPFTLTEAACAFRLPSPPVRDIAGLPVRRFKTSMALLTGNLANRPGIIRMFDNIHHGQQQPVYMDSNDRMRHCFIIGQTGTGKSTLMESMILQDIRAGRGLAVIDPHGEMIDDIIPKLPKERVDDVIIFDLLDRERPLGFNIIEWRSIEERDLIIDELYRTLDHIYDMKQTGGPIFELHFRNTMKLLMGETPRPDFFPTILEFVNCYIDKSFRHWLLDTMHDSQVQDFFKEAEAAGGDVRLENVSPYVTSKFGRFISDTTLKRIIGQQKSSLDFEDIMESGKILLVKLAKGRFGSQVSALLANMLVARFKFAAMKRGEMRKEDRREFYLYVDEAHNLPHDNFTELLAEARKYRLGLTLATQYCSQLGNVQGRGNDLLSAIFGNVGTMVVFRTGSGDAELLAKGFTPYFSMLDIVGLPNYHGYARMNLNAEAPLPFSFRTFRDVSETNPELGARVRTLSRLKFGTDVCIVDAEIAGRRATWKNQAESQ
jgi:DNA helicase HerA-like ATPase